MDDGGEWFRWILSGAAVVISGMATVILGDQRSKQAALSERIETVRNENSVARTALYETIDNIRITAAEDRAMSHREFVTQSDLGSAVAGIKTERLELRADILERINSVERRIDAKFDEQLKNIKYVIENRSPVREPSKGTE